MHQKSSPRILKEGIETSYYISGTTVKLLSVVPLAIGVGVNNKIILDSQITSNWKYRQYIQQNANQIMKYNSMESINASGNNPYYGTDISQSTANMPHLYNSLQSKSITHDSDLKRDFLNKQRLNARMVAPSISTNNF